MNWLRRIWYIATGRRHDSELAEEIAFHRAMKARELRDAGVADDSISGATRRALGNELLARQRARDVWMWPWLQDVSQDVRFGLRMFIKERRFVAAAVLTLGFGLAVNNAVFTIVNATLFRDLPFERADRLIAVRTEDPRGLPSGLSYPDYLEWQRQTTVFEQLGAELNQPVTISDADHPAERLTGFHVSHMLFRMLRVAPLLGRDFSIDDDREGAPPVAILSYDVWRIRYGGDAAIVGRTVRINEQPTTVIGVMPERFAYPLVTDVWMSMSTVTAAQRDSRTSTAFTMAGRLKPSATIDQARSEIETIAARIAREHPEVKRDRKISVMSLKASYFATGAGMLLLTLLGAGLVVLLVACANVANLLLARSWHRAREVAVRQAIGATRWRIVRQLLIECALIAAAGALLGAWLSFFGIDAISRAFTVNEINAPDRPRYPFWFDPSMDGMAWMFFGIAFLIASLGAGLIPAVQLSRMPANETLKDGGRSGQHTHRARRWAGALVVAQLAFSLVLLSGGALLTRAFLDLYYTDPIIDTRDLVQMRLTLPPRKYATAVQRQQFFRQLDERLTDTPTFTSATLSSESPLYSLATQRRTMTVDGQQPEVDKPLPTAAYRAVGPRYFETINLHATRGRTFTVEDELAAREAAVVNERFVAVFFPDDNPIGKRIRMVPVDSTDTVVPWLTIVGVVPTLPDLMPNLPPDPVVYAPLMGESTPTASLFVIVRGASKAAAAGALRDQVRVLDADLPVFAIQTVDELVALSRMGARMAGSWFQTLAFIAVVLALVGLYALTAHGVSQRVQEIGLRMALGAQTWQVMWLFVRRTVVHLALGFTLGMTGALFIGTLMSGFLGATHPRDPLTLSVVVVVFGAIALTATVWPALKAARVSPVIVLHTD